MNRSLVSPLAAGLVWSALAAGPLPAQAPPAGTLRSAAEVLDDLQAVPLKRIPPALLADAQAVAVVPHVLKAGFVVGGREGYGVVLTRGPDGAWGGPTFVVLGGASIGLQAGVQATDMVLVFKTRDALDRVLRGGGKLTLGADVAVAAGPVGRQAEAGTDANLRAEIYSYSRSRGLFAGVSLEGAALVYDYRANQEFARRPRPGDLVAAEVLRARLTAMSPPKPPAGSVPGPLPPVRLPDPPAPALPPPPPPPPPPPAGPNP